MIAAHLTQIQARDLQNKSIQGVNRYADQFSCISGHKINHANNKVHACVHRHTHTYLKRK